MLIISHINIKIDCLNKTDLSHVKENYARGGCNNLVLEPKE